MNSLQSLASEGWDIILTSQSPRRQELLSGLGVAFRHICLEGIDEHYPLDMPAEEVALYLSRKKAEAYRNLLSEKSIVITADTIVVLGTEILGKPRSEAEAIQMLTKLQGQSHKVITGVSLCSLGRMLSFQDCATVHFAHLSEEDIRYYVEQYKPLDKAGAYGIQEWIGYRGIRAIEGSFYTVMGLPTQALSEALLRFCKGTA